MNSFTFKRLDKGVDRNIMSPYAKMALITDSYSDYMLMGDRLTLAYGDGRRVQDVLWTIPPGLHVAPWYWDLGVDLYCLYLTTEIQITYVKLL